MPRKQTVSIPVLNPGDFESDEEYQYHLELCRILAQSQEDSAAHPEHSAPADAFLAELREKYER